MDFNDINWWYVGGGLAIFIGLMLWEDSREYIMDGVAYFISFVWIVDGWEFFIGMFENLNEFSVGGLAFGLGSMGVVYAARNYMLQPFLQHMSLIQATFWMIATYATCGVVGYLIGKRLFEDG